jgi:hypothetical protein
VVYTFFMRYLIVCFISCLFWAESFGQNGKVVSRKRQQLLSIETIQIKPDLLLKLSEYDVILCKTLVKSNSEEVHNSNEYYISNCSSHSLVRSHSLIKFQQLHHKLIFKPEISPSRYNLVDLVSVYSGVNKFSDNLLSIRGARPDANIVLIDGMRAIEYENAFIPFDEGQSVKVKIQ